MKLNELAGPQAKIMSTFKIGSRDAEDVIDFVAGNRDWEDLSDVARTNLYAYYEKTMPYGNDEEHVKNPKKFIVPALKKDFGL